MAVKITKIIANFDTSLVTTLSIGAISGTLKFPVVDDDNVAVPNGKYVMAFDLGNSKEEHLIFDLVGTTGAMTNIKTVSRQGVETVGCLKQHRIGAKVWLTDFANTLYFSQILAGTIPFDGLTPLKYDVTPPFANPLELVTKAYVDSVAIAGAPNASTTTKGLVQEATQAEIDANTATGSTGAKLFTQPATLVLSKYGTQLPTVGEKAALVSNGTPSGANKYVLENSTATGLTAGITNALKTTTASVNVAAAIAPTVGQVVTATSATTATWQTPLAPFPTRISAIKTVDQSSSQTTADLVTFTTELLDNNNEFLLTGTFIPLTTGHYSVDFNTNYTFSTSNSGTNILSINGKKNNIIFRTVNTNSASQNISTHGNLNISLIMALIAGDTIIFEIPAVGFFTFFTISNTNLSIFRIA